MTNPPELLLLSGSLRAASTNEAVIRTAAAQSPARGVVFEGLAALPHFNPDDDRDPLPGPVAELRAAIARADAILICTPEYAGTLPGSFKNLLDWTVGGDEINDKPTAWINAAAPGRGGGADATLRTVLGYTGAAIIEEACLKLAFDRSAVDAAGLITDDQARQRITEAITLLTSVDPLQP